MNSESPSHEERLPHREGPPVAPVAQADGPLEIERHAKDDGRSLILYKRKLGAGHESGERA